MKIDLAKPIASAKNTFAKQNSSNTGKSSFAADGGGEAGAGEETVGGNDFASILESLGNKEKKADSKKPDSSKTEKQADSVHEQQSKRGQTLKNNLSSNSAAGEDAAAAANARAVTTEVGRVEAEPSLPPARQILHIADLERIVSSVRMHQFDGQNQLVVTLKNSVFNGLQIKLTTDENRRVTAEFIAANEKVKTQIDQRSGDLTELLRRRGVQVTSLQTTIDAGTSGGDQDRQRANVFELAVNNVSPNAAANNVESDAESVLEANEASAHTYRV